MTDNSDSLVLRIFPERKEKFIQSVDELDKGNSQYILLLHVFRETSRIYNTNMDCILAWKVADVYVKKIDPLSFSKHINQLLDSDEFWKTHARPWIVDYIVRHNYGELITQEKFAALEKEEFDAKLKGEPTVLERAREREKKRETLTRRRTAVYEPADQF